MGVNTGTAVTGLTSGNSTLWAKTIYFKFSRREPKLSPKTDIYSLDLMPLSMIILIFESFKCEGDLLSQSALRLGSLQRLPDWAGPAMVHGVMQTPAGPHSVDRAFRLTIKNMA